MLFMWGANNHTVTKGSQLEPCNKTADAFFASGTHDKDFSCKNTFTPSISVSDGALQSPRLSTPLSRRSSTALPPVTVRRACSVSCKHLRFSMPRYDAHLYSSNPPNALGTASTSVAAMMSSMSATDKDVKAYAAYTDTQTAGTAAANWGTNMDMAGMPDWAMAPALENVMYTRNFLAANPELMKGMFRFLSSMSTLLNSFHRGWFHRHEQHGHHPAHGSPRHEGCARPER